MLLPGLISTAETIHNTKIITYKLDNSDNLEDLINKSKDEDVRFESNSLPIIYFSLAHISLGEVKGLRLKHIKLYDNLKKESGELIKLGRADSSLFDRWFKDIDQELSNIATIESNTLQEIKKISLLRLNGFVKELENVIANKR